MRLIKNVVGLDLGSHTLKAVELRQNLREVEPVQFRSEAWNLADVPESDRLEHFVRSHELPAHQIVCAISGQHLSTRNLGFPFSDKRRLDRAVPFEVEDNIPFDIEDLVIDWDWLRRESSEAEVTVCMAPRESIRQILEQFSEAQLQPRIVEADGLVLANLATIFGLEGTHLLADIGHRTTQFTLLIDGRPALSRSLSGAGEALSQAIARDRGWSFEEAERFKCEQGLLGDGFEQAGSEAIAVLDQISREIVRTLETPAARSAGALNLPKVTLLGGTSRLHKLEDYLGERTGYETQRLSLPPGAEDAALMSGGDPALYGKAMALALRNTSRAETAMDFRQGEFRYRQDFRRFIDSDLRAPIALSVLVLLLFIGQIGNGIATTSRQSEQVRDQVAELYQEAFPDEAPPSNPLSALRRHIDEARERADFLGAYGKLQSALDLLGEISQRIPSDIEVGFDELNIDRRVIRIKVHAPNFEAVDRITNALSDESAFRNTKVAGDIQNDKRRGGVTFSLNIALDS